MASTQGSYLYILRHILCYSLSYMLSHVPYYSVVRVCGYVLLFISREVEQTPYAHVWSYVQPLIRATTQDHT